jgi:DNA-binding MarR family transcriptional regulator
LSRKEAGRLELEHQLSEELGRRLSTRTILFHQVVAESLGLNPTDLKCLDLARSEADVTAGRIAGVTGLTTAAVTSVLDRLEKAGLVQRVRDARDRRKVLVRLLPERAAEVGRLFESLDRAMRRLYAKYSTADLALILEFAARLEEVMQAETRKLRDRSGSSVPPPISPRLIVSR